MIAFKIGHSGNCLNYVCDFPSPYVQNLLALQTTGTTEFSIEKFVR